MKALKATGITLLLFLVAFVIVGIIACIVLFLSLFIDINIVIMSLVALFIFGGVVRIVYEQIH